MRPSTGAASAGPRTVLRRERPTLGILYGWQVYGGDADLYLETLVKSLTAAARRRQVNLLTALAVGAQARIACPAWPSPGPSRIFAPVGPWNTDGLIVINPLPMPETVAEARRFQDDGHPVVYLTTGPHEPTIAPDNEGGIALAVEHLVEHGHRRIAFLSCDDGDGPARKRAYEAALRHHGLEVDPALVADGSHERLAAMRAVDGLLDSDAEFTALVASNGNSGRGALERLRERGLAVPEDIALVAFDDLLEALATEPAVTSVHFPVEEAAEAAVDALLDWVEHGRVPPPTLSVATHLVERESCGCAPSYDGAAAERDRRALARRLVVRSEVVRAVSAFSNRLLATRRLDMTALGRILAETLADPSVPEPLLGIYGQEDDDPVAWTAVQPSDGGHVVRFATRSFPPPELGVQEPFQLIVTPLRLHEEFGFLALASDDVASCTEIVHHAQTAFRSARELHLAQEERLRLLARTVEVSEQERRRIAADLHDGPVQKITATAFSIDLLVNHLARGERDVEGLARNIRDELAEEIALLRRMFSELLPPVLDERGIGAAISADAAELLPPETRYTMNDHTAAIRFAHDVETGAHRIAREALLNVKRHAHATHVKVDLDHVGDNLRLIVTDDGAGFDPEALTPNKHHLGLESMRERAESLAGELHIESSPDTGTRLQATLPWRHPATS